MKIAIGTQNKGKIEAVNLALDKYELLKNAVIISVEAETGVSKQPIGLEEIISGAQNRAKQAYLDGNADLGFGIESGIFPVPQTKSDYMDTTCCAIFDGKKFHLGLSSCFEYPAKMIQKIIHEGKEISEIAVEMGFSENSSFRENTGMIGKLTKGRITRTDYTHQAVQMALIHLENPEHY